MIRIIRKNTELDEASVPGIVLKINLVYSIKFLSGTQHRIYGGESSLVRGVRSNGNLNQIYGVIIRSPAHSPLHQQGTYGNRRIYGWCYEIGVRPQKIVVANLSTL